MSHTCKIIAVLLWTLLFSTLLQCGGTKVKSCPKILPTTPCSLAGPFPGQYRKSPLILKIAVASAAQGHPAGELLESRKTLMSLSPSSAWAVQIVVHVSFSGNMQSNIILNHDCAWKSYRGMECDLNGFQSIRYVNGHGGWVQTLPDTIKVPVHLMVAMGLKGILNWWTASCSLDATSMPRLTANQRCAVFRTRIMSSSMTMPVPTLQ